MSTLIPKAFVLAGVLGALTCLGRFIGFYISGDLAWEESVLWFAFWSLGAFVGAQDMVATDLHESDERSGF